MYDYKHFFIDKHLEHAYNSVIEFRDAKSLNLIDSIKSNLSKGNVMNLQNTQKLLMAFPRLYRSIANKNLVDAANFDFQIDDGWFGLLYELSEKIEKAAKHEGLHGDRWPDVQIVEAKYASLRFKLRNETEQMHRLTFKYELKSTRICELCGQAGYIRQADWLYCLCDQCSTNH